ncbi:uncharacterized protein MKK02DRAFT_41147 [Dioszegia hungarica]|uniref:Uncharacterized protein n=1 Tax=Dioszegia hungarica TaxID=4972 RepID=A0AA38LRD1_9TREE|nr:uncharacterized protein MKK02DRAFT_41147 [Dioszegia hungarica]KAI9632835.1 hypothetical protein MKK02DRAFT_41147 [Dioszegia hungarica]
MRLSTFITSLFLVLPALVAADKNIIITTSTGDQTLHIAGGAFTRLTFEYMSPDLYKLVQADDRHDDGWQAGNGSFDHDDRLCHLTGALDQTAIDGSGQAFWNIAPKASSGANSCKAAKLGIQLVCGDDVRCWN